MQGHETKAKLQQLRNRVTKLSEDVHTIAYRLHPSILDDLGLPSAVRAFVDDFRNLTINLIQRLA